MNNHNHTPFSIPYLAAVQDSGQSTSGSEPAPRKPSTADNQLVDMTEPVVLPILPLIESVVFPYLTVPVMLKRESSLQLCKEAVEAGEYIVLLPQVDENKENPSLLRDFHRYGVIGRIINLIRLPDGSMSAMVQTLARIHITRITSKSPYLRGKGDVCHEAFPEVIAHGVAPIDPENNNVDKYVVMMASIKAVFYHILSLVGDESTQEMKEALEAHQAPLAAVNFIASNGPTPPPGKARILAINDPMERYMALLDSLYEAEKYLNIKKEISSKTHENLTRQQREHFLKAQIDAMQDELGQNDIEDQDYNELIKRAEAMKWPAYAREHFDREIRKLERFNASMPEYAIQYTYLDTMLSLPWDNCKHPDIDIQNVINILNEDHYGLEEVKDRILEQVALLKINVDSRQPIICLYGPPGVGKTSLGNSIAKALGREYARISLGGVHDEAEIRGHRRTYIGAMPGRIIAALKKCDTSNPVIVLDEIDKIGKDFKGDPQTALLEVLDPEQNVRFHDNYLDVDYDLSRVLFIATANDLSTVSRPLLDRMELIEINTYVLDEKIQIAKHHLVPKTFAAAGMELVPFTDEALGLIAERYTRESGVRLLEKKIAKIVRKMALEKVKGQPLPSVIGTDEVRHYLGPEEITSEKWETNKYLGVVTGLAWTSVGGEILMVEASLTDGKGEKMTLTGSLGDVMKESATIARQYLRAHADEAGIDAKLFSSKDMHIHVPEGAIPKDGPSAGVTMVTALASIYSGRKVRERLAMSGEITLRGKILPVGGLKEKVLAAKSAGITTIALCEENRRDISKIPARYLEGLEFRYFTDIQPLLDFALLPKEN